MSSFSVVLLTAPPTAAAEAGGAFVKVDGRECLLRSAELFLNRDSIHHIIMVIASTMMEEAKRKFSAHLGFTGIKMISGGATWAEQLGAGADKISAECTHVIVHDAARPAVPYGDLDALLAEAERHRAVALAGAVKTELVRVDSGGKAVSFHPPKEFMQVLSPWSFARDLFLEMAKTGRQPAASEVALLRSSPLNIRVNGSGDAGMAKMMLGMLPKPKARGPENPFEEAQW